MKFDVNSQDAEAGRLDRFGILCSHGMGKQ